MGLDGVFKVGHKLLDDFAKIIIPTNFARPMIQYVYDTIGKKNLIGVEIGVASGDNAKSILKTLPIKKLYLIDPYVSYTQDDKRRKVYPEEMKKMQNNVAPFKDKVTFLKLTSEEAINSIPNNLDFIYIDGNHSEENVRQDIELYYPKVRIGGVLGGHDFCTKWKGVCKAVLEFTEKNNLKLFGKNSDWWVVKKK